MIRVLAIAGKNINIVMGRLPRLRGWFLLSLKAAMKSFLSKTGAIISAIVIKSL